MVTSYQIPCSCGCGKVILRNVYFSGACKIRAYRDKEKQVINVDSGEVIPVPEIIGQLLDAVKPSVQGVRCDYCRADSFGTFKMLIYDDKGEHERTKSLCEFHYRQAKQEGVITQ